MTESFKHFIVESEDRESDITRIITLIQKRMPQMLNTKIYRYGGKDGVQTLSGGAVGYLFFFGQAKAFRVRVRKHHIEGFDIWKKFTMNGRPDFTIHTEDASVAQITSQLKKIAAVIKTPKIGQIEVEKVAESISISFDETLLEMAKGVSPEQFLKFAQDAGVDVKSVTFDQIVKIARDNNVGVPNKKWLDGQKIGRGKWTLVPGGGSEGAAAGGSSAEAGVAKGGKAGDPILFLKITAQDPVTKKFLPTADNKQAQALYKQIQGTMNPDAKPSKEELRDVDTLFGHLYRLVTMAATNKLRSLLIYGGPGTGKTYTIMQAIKEANLVAGQDYVKLSGKVTAVELYKTLFMFRKGGMVLLDDCDSVWKDKDSANILKAALDTSPVREISSASSMTKNVSKMKPAEREEYNDRMDKYLEGEDVDDEPEDDEDGEEGGGKKKKKEKMKFPSTFDFKGRVVFISNLRKDEFDSAIMSRSAKIDMSLTPEETLKRMRAVLPHLGGTDVSMENKEKLINVLLKLNGEGVLDVVTMREFIKGLDVVRSGDPNWEDLVQYM